MVVPWAASKAGKGTASEIEEAVLHALVCAHHDVYVVRVQESFHLEAQRNGALQFVPEACWQAPLNSNCTLKR